MVRLTRTTGCGSRRSRLRNRLRRGVTAVEMAVVVMIVFMFLMGIVEFSRILMTRVLWDNAARAGARLAVVSTATLTDAELIQQIDAYLPAATKSTVEGGFDPNVNIRVFRADEDGNELGSWRDAGFGQAIAVEISGEVNIISPISMGGRNSVNIRAFHMMFSEAN